MGVELNLSIADNLRSPPSQFSTQVHQRDFPTEAFTQEEAQLFESQLNALIGELDSSSLLQILKQREEIIAQAATLAKHDLESKTFGGINPQDNEIGFSVLRPGHILRDAGTGNLQNDWYFDPGTTGWVDWTGDGAGNNFVIGEDQVVLVLGLVDQEAAPSEISGINVNEFGRNIDMVPQDQNTLRLQDNDTEVQAVSLPSLIGQENDDVHIRLRFDRDVERQPRLYGLTFGLGDFMNNEDYAVADYDTM